MTNTTTTTTDDARARQLRCMDLFEQYAVARHRDLIDGTPECRIANDLAALYVESGNFGRFLELESHLSRTLLPQ
jgi:hypothetical protein